MSEKELNNNEEMYIENEEEEKDFNAKGRN